MQIETDADVMWKPDVRETDAEIAERGYRFLQVSNPTPLYALRTTWPCFHHRTV